MLAGLLEWCRVRRRYIAYLTLLLNIYFETSARFGVSIAMLGGMLKKDCNDPLDNGAFCWSEETQASVLGAYFYGYTGQCLTTYLAKRYTGFTATYRVWLIVAALIQIAYPTLAGISPTLVIVSQTIRGLLAGILLPFYFNYISKFSVGNENKILISIMGATLFLGNGTGGLLASLLTTWFSWQYYFYFASVTYCLGLALTLLFVQDSPDKSWYLSEEEKQMMVKTNKDPSSSSTNSPNEETKQLSSSFKSIFCRAYLLAFCIYALAYNMVYYNIFNVVPFYLNKVLKAEPLFISYLNISLSLLIALCTLAFSFIFQNVDKLLTWLQCRMLFTLVPMILQIVFALGLAFNTSIIGGIVILTLSAIAASTGYSGSIMTMNYEMDPINSALIVSVFNSCAQVGGFLGPLLMAAITHTDPQTQDYETVYRQRWAYFFYVVAGMPAAGFLAIVLAYITKPDEWRNRAKERELGDD